MAQVEPASLEEALQADDANYWIQADEINALEDNKTRELVYRDKDMHVISNRWVFRKKYKSNGDVEKYKARLVAKGYSQIPGIDYEETFAPVVKFDSIRTLLAISAAKNLKLYQFDVKTAFLHGNIEETIYMEQPYGFAKDNRVCKLNRSLYGLKQAPRQWNKRIAEFLENYGLAQSRTDPCGFYKTIDAEEKMYLALYVDDVDGLLCGNNIDGINKLLRDMSEEFKLTYGVAKSFVGLQIEMNRNKNRLIIHQSGYALKILKKFNHSECQEVSTPVEPGTKFIQGDDGTCNLRTFPYREAIGSLMYLMIATRPDLAFVVSVLSRYMEKPQQQHWNGVKRVLKYIKGTISYGISFIIGSNNTEMEAYCDADWAGDLDSRRSTSGWLCLLNGGPISWCSKKQGITATSTTEFIAICGAAKQIVWLRRLLSDFNCKQYYPTRLKCDNQRAITITKNPGFMKGTKHLEVQYYYTYDQQKAGEIAVEYIDSSRQLADPLTKPLPRDKFVGLRALYDVNAFKM